MRYSIKDEDIKKIYSAEDGVIDNIVNRYAVFVEEIVEWGKKFNSTLVLKISKKTVGMIDDNVWNAYREYSEKFDDSGISFINISKRYNIGETALSKVMEIQNTLIEKMCSLQSTEINYLCEGDVRYDTALINEYKQIIDKFIFDIENFYEDDSEKARTIIDENILGESFFILVKVQYETLIKISHLYNQIFDIFLEWYERTVRENKALLDEILREVTTLSETIGDEQIDKIISQIIDQNISISSENNKNEMSNNGLNSANSNPDQIEKNIDKALNSTANSLVRELNTPEKVRDFKKYLNSCEQYLDEYRKEPDGENEKFHKIADFIKDGAKKHGKPIMKALSIIVPLIAPQGHIVGKIATKLPDIMECFTSGKLDKKEDIPKVELGLDCLKSMGVDNFSENGDEIKSYIEKNSKSISEDITKKILSNEKYLNLLDIDEAELSNPANQKLYKEVMGKDVMLVPQKKEPYDYDFEKFNLKELNDIEPKIKKEKVEDITNVVDKEMLNFFSNDVTDNLLQELAELKEQVESRKGYVQINDEGGMKQLISKLQHITQGNQDINILDDIEGRYNKEDMGMLLKELLKESENNKNKPNFSKACNNFLRRQVGYPAKEENDIIVNNIRELIPVINEKCDCFIVEDKQLASMINSAQNILLQKNGKIRRKGIIRTLWSNATVLGGTIGIGTLFILAGSWPLGLLWSWASIGVCLADESSSAYSNLAYKLGDKRTDYLIENYHNISQNKFSLKIDRE